MTRQEFNDRCKVGVSDIEYSDIEVVYTFHPSISEINGKDQIAMLVSMFGMRVIRDMLPTALKAQEYEEKILKMRNELDAVVNEFNEFKRGAM